MNAFVLVSIVAVVQLAAIAVDDVRADCWDTGCQLNSWAVKGCGQYGRTVTEKRPCPNGFVYTCCSKVQVSEGQVPTTDGPACDGQTKCLPKKGPKTDGCEKISKKIVKKMDPKPCDNGQVFSCCKNPGYGTTEDDAPHDQQQQ